MALEMTWGLEVRLFITFSRLGAALEVLMPAQGIRLQRSGLSSRVNRRRNEQLLSAESCAWCQYTRVFRVNDPAMPTHLRRSWQAMYGNIQDGYVEALVRGYRSGLLTAADYNNLSQCDNLDDVKLHLVRGAALADQRNARSVWG